MELPEWRVILNILTLEVAIIAIFLGVVICLRYRQQRSWGVFLGSVMIVMAILVIATRDIILAFTQ